MVAMDGQGVHLLSFSLLSSQVADCPKLLVPVLMDAGDGTTSLAQLLGRAFQGRLEQRLVWPCSACVDLGQREILRFAHAPLAWHRPTAASHG